MGGMLNDRDKINRPGSQHGFINFLVAPLAVATVKLFPWLHPLSTHLANNLEEWQRLWIEDAKPSAEEVAKRTADVNKVRNLAMDLQARTKMGIVHTNPNGRVMTLDPRTA